VHGGCAASAARRRLPRAARIASDVQRIAAAHLILLLAVAWVLAYSPRAQDTLSPQLLCLRPRPVLPLHVPHCGQCLRLLLLLLTTYLPAAACGWVVRQSDTRSLNSCTGIYHHLPHPVTGWRLRDTTPAFQQCSSRRWPGACWVGRGNGGQSNLLPRREHVVQHRPQQMCVGRWKGS
jgi:hypothetical protein